MSTHFTPGPWVAIARTNAYIDIEAPNQPGYSAQKIANTSLANHEANARLIAASPDLLALHKKHIELMVEIAMELKNPRLPLATTVAASIRMLAEAAKETIDAIAKATGEKI